jgi:helicase
MTQPGSGPAFARACGVTTLPVSALLTFPTGSGKTFLALEAARHTLADGQKVILMVPLKSLAAELEQTWQAALPEWTVQSFTRDSKGSKPYREVDVIILTGEKLDLLTRSWGRHHSWLAKVRLLVADEIHLIADPGRGAAVDAAITRLRYVNPLLRVLALTATCGNPLEIAQWLKGIHLGGGERPVPLTWTPFTVQDAAGKSEVLKQVLHPGESTLIFVHSRRRAEDLAKVLRAQGRAAEAYHAGFLPEIRAGTEQRFRSGQTDTLVTTPAMDVGVNLPCTHAVLHDLTLASGGKFTLLGINAAWQRAGRAGRVSGQRDARVSVIGTQKERPAKYLTPDFEALISPLAREEHLLSFVLGCLDGGLVRTAEQLDRLVNRSLAAHQGTLNSRQAIADLLLYGALEEQEQFLKVTLLGRIASQSMLPVLTVKAARFLPEDPAVLDVLLHVSRRLSVPSLPDSSVFLVEATLQVTPSRALDAHDPFSSLEQSGAAILLHACLNGEAETAEAFGLYPTQLTAMREEAVRVLAAWSLFRPEIRKVRLVRTMLETCLPLGAATLALLPGVGAATAKRLVNAGIEDVEDLAVQNEDAPLPGFSAARSRMLILAAEQLVKTLDTDLLREPPPGRRIEYELDLQAHIDPLRLMRALTLTVQPHPAGFTVSGGQAEHLVTTDLACDCPDHTTRRRCKHILAVQLSLNCADVLRMASVLADP